MIYLWEIFNYSKCNCFQAASNADQEGELRHYGKIRKLETNRGSDSVFRDARFYRFWQHRSENKNLRQATQTLRSIQQAQAQAHPR